MRKVLFTFLLVLAATSLQAQEYNMFNPADVDENGWLWFDTQEKVDKYVGTCNEDDYKVDPAGKLIQLVYADQNPTYPETTVDPTIAGAGTDGELGTAGSKTGAIILPAASGASQPNGGGFVVLMPSCSTYSICLSSENNVYCQILSTTNVETSFSDYDVRKVYSLFNKFSGAGIITKTGLESLTNGYNDITIKSDKPVYAYFRNLNKSEVYIHGIKVTTPKQESTGISNIGNTTCGAASFYTVGGVKVANTKDGLKPGVYIVRNGKDAKKYVVK